MPIATRLMRAVTVENAAGYVLAEPRVGVNPGQMVMAAREAFPRDAVVVADGGNTTLWTVALNPVFEPDSFLYSVKMGYLGTGLPFAIGAKLAAPRALRLPDLGRRRIRIPRHGARDGVARRRSRGVPGGRG